MLSDDAREAALFVGLLYVALLVGSVLGDAGLQAWFHGFGEGDLLVPRVVPTGALATGLVGGGLAGFALDDPRDAGRGAVAGVVGGLLVVVLTRSALLAVLPGSGLELQETLLQQVGAVVLPATAGAVLAAWVAARAASRL